jgi:hypothetical protein
MWPVLIAGGFLVGKYIYHRIVDEPPKRKKGPRQEIQIPRSDDGAPLPIVFGKCRVRAPILAWTSPLQVTEPNGEFKIFGIHMLFAVGIPMGQGQTKADELTAARLHKVWFGDYMMEPSSGWLPIVTQGPPPFRGANVTRETLYGGAGGGGGLRGSYWWHGGYSNQTFENTRIGLFMSIHGATPMPGLARQMCLAFTSVVTDSLDPWYDETALDTGGSIQAVSYPAGFVFGESGGVSSISAEVSTYGDIVRGVTGHIFAMDVPGVDFAGDADPAEVIYCILTDPLGKLGLPPTQIDTASFMAASQTLKSESHGYSRAFEDGAEADEMIQDVLRQIDGALDEDPTTGLIRLKLIRPDYDPETIPHITKHNCERIQSFALGGLTNLVNKVKIVYQNRSREYKEDSEQAKNSANAVGQDGVVNEEVLEMRGVNNAELASALAGRELAARSRPIMKCRAVCGRWALRLMRGDPVRLTWSNPDVSGLVFRVADVDRGTLEDGKITLDLISDFFYTWRRGRPRAENFGNKTPVDMKLG